MLPDLESLRCFEAAATHLNFRAAARALHLSPTAFSDRIRRLEDGFGRRLFDRTTRHVALTAAGLKLLPQARRCLEEAKQCSIVVTEETFHRPFELVLGTRFELGLSWLTPALAGLEKRRPERTIHLFFGDSADLLLRAQRGALDATITSARLSTAGFRYEALHEERYVFVGARSLLEQKPLRRPSHAASHVLIDAHPDLPLFRYFRDACSPSEPWAFERILRLGTIGAIQMRVLEGRGVAVLPRYLVQRDLDRERLRIICPKIELNRDDFRLVWRERHPLESELVALAEELRAVRLR